MDESDERLFRAILYTTRTLHVLLPSKSEVSPAACIWQATSATSRAPGWQKLHN